MLIVKIPKSPIFEPLCSSPYKFLDFQSKFILFKHILSQYNIQHSGYGAGLSLAGSAVQSSLLLFFFSSSSIFLQRLPFTFDTFDYNS